MNALVCMQAEKRRLHAVPSCGSDRLKRHFREGSVAGISHIRKACAPREPWKIRKKRSYDSENRRIFQLVRDLQSLKKRQNSCYRRNLRAHAFFDMGDVSNWPLRRASKSGVLEKNQKIFHVFSFCCFFTFLAKFLGIFDFLALLSARSRRVLANREERIKKENFSAFFWPVEICEILVRLLIVKVNKLVYIITRRNRLGSGWDFNNF